MNQPRSQCGAAENTAHQTHLLPGLMRFQVWSVEVKASAEQTRISVRHLTFQRRKQDNPKAMWHTLSGLKPANQHVSAHNHPAALATEGN